MVQELIKEHLVSVITPSFNAAKVLPHAINSVLSQSYQNFEIIVVDDGSTDNTKEVVEKYINNSNPCRIRYIYQENAGVSNARNTGMKKAKGQYIAFLDSDDIFLEESLAERVHFLSQNQAIALVFTDYYLINDKNINLANKNRAHQDNFWEIIKPIVEYHSGDNHILKKTFYANFFLFKVFPIWTGTVLLRKAALTPAFKFREDISVCEDLEFWLKIVKNNRVGYISKPLSCYNHYQSNLSKNPIMYSLNNIKFFKELLQDRQIDKNIIKKLISNNFFNLGYYYYKNKNYFRSKLLFMKALLYNPYNPKILLFLFLPPNKIVAFLKKLLKLN